MADRSALVTGATGFIGSQLVPALVAQGWTVTATGRRPRPETLPPETAYQAADLAGEDNLESLLEGVTDVFHLAGASSSLADEAEMHRANVAATERLVTAALKSSSLKRLVYMSSTSVYGETVSLPSPVLETVEPQPSRAYGKAKWATEQVVWSAGSEGLPVVVLRPVSVFGPRNVKLLASAVLDIALERFANPSEPVPVPAAPIEQRLVHIDDLLRATIHLAIHPQGADRAYNVVFPSYPSNHQVAAAIARQLGVEVVLTDDPSAGLSYPERVAARERMLAGGMRPDILLTKERFRFMRKANINNRLSVDALLSTGFQFSQADLDTAIGATVGWYREARWIL